MSINCKKCELSLRPTQKFCSRCGSPNDWKPEDTSIGEVAALAGDLQLETATILPSRKPEDFYAEGVEYFRGSGGNQDHGLAIASFMNAADGGHLASVYAVGVMYLRGLGTVANLSLAIEYLKKAADAGFTQADELLTTIHAGADTSKFPVLLTSVRIVVPPSKMPEYEEPFIDAENGAKGVGKLFKIAISGVSVLVIVGAVAYGYDNYRLRVIEEAQRQEIGEAQRQALASKAEDQGHRQKEVLRDEQETVAGQGVKIDMREVDPQSPAPAVVPSSTAHSSAQSQTLNYSHGTYVGQSADGKADGQGKYTSAKTGTTYTGSFVEDKFNGAGVMTWSDGSRFVGTWQMDVGVKGIITYPDGRTVNGVVQNAKFTETGINTTASVPVQFAPSFDCTKASIDSEKIICSDAELSALDVQLTKSYLWQLKSAIDKTIIQKSQLDWLKNYQRICRDKACLVDAYNKRLRQIEG